MSTVNSVNAQMETTSNLSSSNASSGLGKTDFLQILVAQMSNQDPMEPTSDTDFIAQLAQFSVLEQMQQMNSGSMTSQAYSLIGKMVYIEEGTNTEAIYGKVDGVLRKDGIDYLMVGDEIYEVSSVTGVLDESFSYDDTEDKVLQSVGLIGKTVTANITNDEGEEQVVTGEVQKIKIHNNAVFVVVDGVDIPVSDLEEIAA